MTPANDADPPSKPSSVDHEVALKDADRLMMQIVQTSLSLIGFGFTINAFFNSVSESVAPSADRAARQLGLAMLCLGVLFLAMGVWNQVRYRQALARRFAHLPRSREARAYSAASSMTAALCLLLIGLFGVGSILIRAAY